MTQQRHTVAAAFPTILVASANYVPWKQMVSLVRAMANATTGCPATVRVRVKPGGELPIAPGAEPYFMGLNASHAHVVRHTALA